MLGEESLATLEDEVAERFSRRGERLGVRVDDMPSTHDRQPFRFRRSDQLVIELEAHGVQRQQRDAHSGHDGLLDGLVARHLHDHPRGHLIRLHELVERRARARTRLAHDESFAEQRPCRHPLGARERVLDAGDQPVRVHRERLGPRGPVLGRPAHDGELNRTLAHERDHFLAIAGDPQAHFDTRVLVPELRQQPRQKVFRGADHGDIQHPGLEAAKPGDHVLGVAHRGQDPLRVGEHVLADHGEGHLAARAIKQRQPDLGLQFLDLHRDRRSRELQLLRRAREAQVPGDRRKDP